MTLLWPSVSEQTTEPSTETEPAPVPPIAMVSATCRREKTAVTVLGETIVNEQLVPPVQSPPNLSKVDSKPAVPAKTTVEPKGTILVHTAFLEANGIVQSATPSPVIVPPPVPLTCTINCT